MGRATIVTLRVLLVMIMLGGLVAQLWFFPTLAEELARIWPELSWLRWPMLIAVILIILGAQVALAAIWALLSMVERDSVFSAGAFRWVDVIIVAAIVDTLLVLGIFVVLSYGAKANPPGLALAQLALIVCGVAFALLMSVMKGLLWKASNLTAELSEVI